MTKFFSNVVFSNIMEKCYVASTVMNQILVKTEFFSYMLEKVSFVVLFSCFIGCFSTFDSIIEFFISFIMKFFIATDEEGDKSHSFVALIISK